MTSPPNALRGMTWSHPRGYAPLQAAAKRDAVLRDEGECIQPIDWAVQSLAVFESTSILELAATFDLIVLDHPGLGAGLDALQPLDALISADELATWQQKYVGDSADSYFYRGHQWAVPIDAATQVCAYRPDLIGIPPRTWSDVEKIAMTHQVALPTKAPHTLLTFLGICAAVQPRFVATDRHLVPTETALVAYSLLSRLVRAMDDELVDKDPIELLDRMAIESIDCCPLAYGYVNYVNPPSGCHRISFADAPSWREGGTPGSVLGGTGLAISRSTKSRVQALEQLLRISSDDLQLGLIPRAGGQPAATAAWDSPDVDRDWGFFYSRTRRSQMTAWRRPRHAGWIEMQHVGSVDLLDAVQKGMDPVTAIGRVNELYRKSLHSSNH